MDRDLSLIPQLSRYTIVSVVALAADFAFYVLLFTAGVKASIAGIFAYAGGMFVHYLLSTKFVFDATCSRKSEMRQFIEFVLSGLVGLTLTGFVIAVATEACGLGPIFAKAVAALVSFLAVFVIRRSFVFAPELPADDCDGRSRVYAKSASSQ